MIIPLNAFTLRDEKERVNNSPIVHSLPLPGMLLEGKEKNEKKQSRLYGIPFINMLRTDFLVNLLMILT